MKAPQVTVLVVAAFLLAGCSAGHANESDSCISVYEVGEAISRQAVDSYTRAWAAAEHVLANTECYSAETIAVARTGLVEMSRPTPSTNLDDLNRLLRND